MKVSRVGEKYITNEGYEIEIVEYFGAKVCTIKFDNGVTIKNKQYNDIVRGKIKNPYHKSVFEVGYFGVGKYGSLTYPKTYKTWTSMLERCYNLEHQERQPTYKGCKVDERWHNFQNFAQWYEENYKESCVLDKDILVKGNKIYSFKNCCFVPQDINNLLIKANSIRGKYPIGVSLHKEGRFQVRLNIYGKRIYLGLFDTYQQAFQAYKITKEQYIKEMAEKWRYKITEPTYQALINYQVEITD